MSKPVPTEFDPANQCFAGANLEVGQPVHIRRDAAAAFWRVWPVSREELVRLTSKRYWQEKQTAALTTNKAEFCALLIRWCNAKIDDPESGPLLRAAAKIVRYQAEYFWDDHWPEIEGMLQEEMNADR